MLLGQRGLTEEQAGGQAEADPALRTAFRADDRLVKTLLLAALAPGVTALRGMTARRLAALNHGTIRSLIPGQEVAEVTRRLRGWASKVAELKVGGEDDPSVRLQLVGVDLGAILDRVTHVDNPAARRLLVREVLLGELSVRDDGTLELAHPVVWRGSRRTLEVVYGNVRDHSDLRDEIFEPSQVGNWRLVLDYPFDATTHSAVEDRWRMDTLRERAPAHCVAWLPAFVTGDVLGKIANLVRIEYLLTGNRLDEAAGHLGADDRQRARDLLGNQGDSLRSELRFVLRQAYGLARPNENDVLDWSDHLVSRDPGVRPKLDVGRPFADALTQLVDQLYTALYPDHPDFDRQRKGAVVSTGELRTVLDVVRRAADEPEGRTETEKAERAPLQRIAHPLTLGEVGDGSFVLSRHWEAELERRAAQEGLADADIPVRRVRGWIAPLGLETRVANLVIATYAELAQRAWVRAGRVVEPPATVDGVGDDLLLRRQELPSEPEWGAAIERAGVLFGYTSPSRVVSPRAVARFGRLAEQIATLRTPAAELVAPLARQYPMLLVVVDGMSGAVATELTAELTTHRGGWTEIVRDPDGGREAVLAALPTETTYSRTSLFCAALRAGTQADERTAFAGHPFWPQGGAVLVHKAGVGGQDGNDLGHELEQALAPEGGSRVVAVVLNAVDDSLKQGRHSADPSWSLRDVPGLPQLLERAVTSDRVVVLTSDHGHVLEHGGQYRPQPGGHQPGAGAARWRGATSPAGPDEVEVAGPRVLTPDGRAVLAASEHVRYGKKAHGYHGGATLAEVAIPLMVLLPPGMAVFDGWYPHTLGEPAWWNGDPVAPTMPAPTRPASTRPAGRRTAPPPPTEDLFSAQVSRGRALLDAPAFTTLHSQLPPNRVPPVEVFQAVVDALAVAGGRLPVSVVVQLAGSAGRNPRGFVTALGRVLNVDGFTVLGFTDDGRSVVLDQQLLDEQFPVPG